MLRESRHTLSYVLLAAFVAVACADEPDAPPGSAARGSSGALATGTREPSIDRETLEQLDAIGYVSGSIKAGPSQGVTRYLPDSAHDGYNFVTSGDAPRARLMDMHGNVVHEWGAEFEDLFPNHPDLEGEIDPKSNFWRHAELLPNGDVLGIWNKKGVFKLDKDSRILWAVPNRAHHDLDVTEAGDIYLLTFEREHVRGIPGEPSEVDYIVVLDPGGKELRRVNLTKALQNAGWRRLRVDFWEREKVRRIGFTRRTLFDPFHTNSLWILSPEEESRLGPPFKAGDVLVSLCLLDTIAVIDMEKENTRWWQTGPFGLQHQPRVTLEGDIVLFNNHVTNDRSSVQIIDPHSHEVIWEYFGPDEDPLYSRTSGAAEMLPNGNVFIIESNKGRVLEVSRDEQIVWEYQNPYRAGDDGSLVAHLYTFDRVDAASLSWLDQR